MSATVPQLGARALRKCGIGLIAESARAALGPVVTSQDVAGRVLRELGVPVAEVARPASAPTVGLTETASRTARAVGINPIAGTLPTGTTNAAGVVGQALRALGANPVGPGATIATVTAAVPARRALLLNGVNPMDGTPGVAVAPSHNDTDIARMALVRLAVISAEETPASTDLALALDQVAAVHERLTALDYAGWPVSAVPASVAAQYVVMVAAMLAPSFGIVASTTVGRDFSMESYSAAQEMIRQQALTGIAAVTRAQDRVVSLHDRLVADGMADWTSDTIPLALSDAYADMVAAAMAPMFGKTVDAPARDAAEAAVRRFVLSGQRGQTLALAALDGLHSEAVANGVADWTLDFIPNAAADAYSDMVQQALSPVYGPDKGADLRVAGMARLRTIALSGPRGQALAEQEVQAVHDALAVQGLVSWPVSAIPAAHVGHYVDLAVPGVALATGRPTTPEQMQADRAARDAAEGAVRKAAVIANAEARAGDRVRAVASELSSLGLADWDADHIPASLADAVADLAGQQMGPEFGRAVDPKAYALAEARLRRIVMGGPLGQALAEQKVRAVHATLDAEGRTRWTLYDIPLFAEEPVVLMAAVLLAPEVGVTADPTWEPMADRALARAVAVPSLRRPVIASYM